MRKDIKFNKLEMAKKYVTIQTINERIYINEKKIAELEKRIQELKREIDADRILLCKAQ